MKQIERIIQMESHLDCAAEAAEALSNALDKYEAAQESIAALCAYYGSNKWRQDYADDEAGLLPKNLKRGILSEDGIWNVLTDCRELEERLSKLAHSMTGTSICEP